MRLTRANYKAIQFACRNFHYAKSTPASSLLGYNVYNDNDEWCGCIVFSIGANNHIASAYSLSQGECIELTRVALNGKQAYTSQALSMAIKRLRQDCPVVRLIVSYADADQSHLGTIYQATNWIYVGLKNEGATEFIVNGKPTHSRSLYHKLFIKEDGKVRKLSCNIENIRKFIDPNATVYFTKGKRKYLMPLDKKILKQILPLSKPYPKADDNWHKIDRKCMKNL